MPAKMKPSEMRAAAEAAAREKKEKEEAVERVKREKKEREEAAKRAKEEAAAAEIRKKEEAERAKLEAEAAERRKKEEAERFAKEEAERAEKIKELMASFSEELIEEIQTCFDIFDRVGDKKIDGSQVIDVLRSMGMNPITEDVNKVVKNDGYENKRLDQLAFCSIYCHMNTQPRIASEDDMIECMKTMDKTNCGTISGASLRTLLCNLGDTLTEEQAEVMMKKYEDENGMVSYSQMIRGLIASNG